jgi:hypothetical protein
MVHRSKHLAFVVIVIPILWFVIVSTFFSIHVYPWSIINALPLIGNATQVANEHRIGLCDEVSITRLYTTDTPWDIVHQSYLDYFRLHYNSANIRLDPNTEKDSIGAWKRMGPNMMTLRERTFGLSVSRIQEAGPTMGTYIWTSYDSNVRDAVAKANSAYEISISYIPDVAFYRENCTD